LNQEFEAVVLGSSHALRDVIAEDLSYNTINLANVSQTINIDILWLKEAVKRQKLKFIILNYSIPTLTGDLESGISSWRFKNYNIYTSIRLDYSAKNNFEFLNGIQKYNFHTISNHLFQHNDLKKEYLEKGSFPLDVHTNHFEEDALKASKRHIFNTQYVDRNKNILKQIIELSKENNFKVVLVTPPAHKSYRELIPSNINNELFSLLNDSDTQNSHVYWFNYYDNNNFNDTHFADSNHLNLKGAKQFTNKIDFFLNEIVVPKTTKDQ
jgi:hypothetical protein